MTMNDARGLEILEAHRLEVGQVLVGDRAHAAGGRGPSRWCGRGAAAGRAGPSNDSTRTVSRVGSATARLGSRRRASWLELDRGADLGHGLDGDRARAARALVQDLDDLGGLLREALAPLPDLAPAAAACA